MSGHRKDLRDAVKAALAADARIGPYTYVKAWVRAKDRDQLPAYTVFIPRDPSGVSDQNGVERRTIIEVIVKRSANADIEDAIDADVDAIEAAVYPALLDVSDLTYADFDGTDFEITGEGNATACQAVVRFSTQIFKPLPTS